MPLHKPNVTKCRLKLPIISRENPGISQDPSSTVNRLPAYVHQRLDTGARDAVANSVDPLAISTNAVSERLAARTHFEGNALKAARKRRSRRRRFFSNVRPCRRDC
jgi:hypothetical protein